MREYVGPPRQATRITFVPGDPPRLAAVAHQDAHSQAVYLWRLDRPEPTILAWTEGNEGVAWNEPVLAMSADGHWLVAGPYFDPRRWDLSVDPPAGPVALQVPAAAMVARIAPPDRLMIVYFRDGPDGVIPQLHAAKLDLSLPGEWSPTHPSPLVMTTDLTVRVSRMSPSDWRLKSVLSNDGKRLAVAPRERIGQPLAREAFVWDVGSGDPSRRVETSGHPCALSFSPDGSRLVVDVGTIYVHDTATLDLLGSWKAKYSYSPGLAFSPDGRLLARTDNSTTVRVYEADTGRQVVAVGGKRGRLTSVAFSPDGLTLATGTHEGPIRVWDVE